MKFVFNWNLINVDHWRLLKITQGQVLRNCICQLYLRSVNPVGGATLPGKLGGPPKPLPYLWSNSVIFPTRFMTWKSEKLYAFQNWSAKTIQKTAAKDTIHNRDRTYLWSTPRGRTSSAEIGHNWATTSAATSTMTILNYYARLYFAIASRSTRLPPDCMRNLPEKPLMC